ncbi:hypothetical protein [Clostridium sp. 'White wine YQ']|uniref:hypothetical protein n=1 Tax=Clostridium sp. 'White wine YQ' TaxID=3027474 RepID=UPI003FCD55DC
MIFGKKNKKGNIAVNLSLVDGIDSYIKGAAVELSIDDENGRIAVVPRAYKNLPTVYIKIEQLIAANVVTEEEIIEKSKSTVGRALVGGVILGPLGAIVGGMSGIGNKVKSNTKYYMVINYNSLEGETKVLSFEIVGASLHWGTFIKELRSRVNPNLQMNIEKELYL